MGIRIKSGQIIDASVVSVPVQRNTRKENAVIKEDARMGLARVKVGVALMNLAYNLRRVEWLIRSKVLR